tara:strand:+ start:128 stop:484 length:357 start_codon:yes stop_codon:yes gene_type:complete
MSEYNWCHNPDCHKIETQSRIRGTGDNKVLRTRKIALNSEWRRTSIWAYFCNHNCLFQFLNKFAHQIADTYSVKQPSETPIKVKKEKYERYRYRYDSVNGQERVPYQSTITTIVRNNE